MITHHNITHQQRVTIILYCCRDNDCRINKSIINNYFNEHCMTLLTLRVGQHTMRCDENNELYINYYNESIDCEAFLTRNVMYCPLYSTWKLSVL